MSVLEQAEATEQTIATIKRKSPACLLFYGTTGGYWTARGSDAVEVCFCTGTALNYSRKHIPDEETSVVFPADRIAGIIARLVKCGNPVATIDEYSNEVHTYWTAAYDPPLDNTLPPTLPPMPVARDEPGVEWMDFAAISGQITGGPTYRQESLPDFSFSNQEIEAPF